MIAAHVSDPTLRRAVLRAASPEEDVFDGALAREAAEFGSPRLLIVEEHLRWRGRRDACPVLVIGAERMREWEAARLALELPPTRLVHVTERLGALIEGTAVRGSVVDRTLAELSRAVGVRLPPPLRGFARRVMEFSHHYRSLHPLAEACGTTRGALKARFRRRGLASPSTCLRWFRVFAVADLLSDEEVTVATAARRLGFTSDGNLCRMLASVTGMTPTELRPASGWHRLLLTFAGTHLTPEHVEGWATLEELFRRRAA
jgi:AraC-like DNA-binding protein